MFACTEVHDEHVSIHAELAVCFLAWCIFLKHWFRISIYTEYHSEACGSCFAWIRSLNRTSPAKAVALLKGNILSKKLPEKSESWLIQIHPSEMSALVTTDEGPQLWHWRNCPRNRNLLSLIFPGIVERGIPSIVRIPRSSIPNTIKRECVAPSTHSNKISMLFKQFWKTRSKKRCLVVES